MPTYRYEHEEAPCALGRQFEVEQSMKGPALTVCPQCGGPVFRVMTPTFISTPRGDTDLRDKGFMKLVKRGDGSYENVTALEGESKVWNPNDPTSMPDLKRRGLD